ncbi:hypothetical protein NWP22_17370 [Anabaenopsis tanganyikae CS-531]|uniref:Transposase n=1 Tax=Anabaenopsis tanganyikae CS-531 TaxID=2785304 RepID=A0ABT6KKA3_9CYAN|nr:hypothetical protein [Anabaenopsis tanganyikae]MDH6107604.1 hypothetical protein [Anabaenopsis tanganyikae CS-531]
MSDLSDFSFETGVSNPRLPVWHQTEFFNPQQQRFAIAFNSSAWLSHPVKIIKYMIFGVTQIPDFSHNQR